MNCLPMQCEMGNLQSDWIFEKKGTNLDYRANVIILMYVLYSREYYSTIGRLKCICWVWTGERGMKLISVLFFDQMRMLKMKRICHETNNIECTIRAQIQTGQWRAMVPCSGLVEWKLPRIFMETTGHPWQHFSPQIEGQQGTHPIVRRNTKIRNADNTNDAHDRAKIKLYVSISLDSLLHFPQVFKRAVFWCQYGRNCWNFPSRFSLILTVIKLIMQTSMDTLI